MNKHLQYLLLSLIFFSFSNILLIAQNIICAETLVVEVGSYDVEAFSGNGAIFQGATAAVWYRYEPTERGVFTVSSCNGRGDTRLVIMLLDDCSKAEELQIINSVEDNCADGKGGNTGSTVDVVAVPGFSYVIYWDNGQSNDPFTWQLTFSETSVEQNGETCATAQSIEAGTHDVTGLTGSGTAFLDAVSAKWYAFTPERDGALFINACDSEVNTRLFVWKGACAASTILAQDDNGCGASGASDLANVLVEQGEIYYIYWDDHYTDDGFTFDLNVMDPTVSTNEQKWSNSIMVYPNPVEQELFIEYAFMQNIDLQFSIFNSLGQRVQSSFSSSWGNGTMTINVADLENGYYFLKIYTNTDFVTKRFAVKR